MIIYNAEGTTDYKPRDPKYKRSWIQFYDDIKTGHVSIMEYVSKTNGQCRAKDCEETDLDGCHVMIASDDWKEVEREIESIINTERSAAAKEMRKYMPKVLKFKNARILVRIVPPQWKRAYPPKGIQRPMFITAMCTGCNDKTDPIELKADTILIPIYDEDQEII